MSSILGRLSNLARGVLLDADPTHASDPAADAALEAELAQTSARAGVGRAQSRPSATPSASVHRSGRPDVPAGSDPGSDAPPRVPRTRTL